jgi:hypothetical protein
VMVSPMIEFAAATMASAMPYSGRTSPSARVFSRTISGRSTRASSAPRRGRSRR